MIYEQLSQESKETLQGMAYFCINNGYCMGMDEGFKSFEGDDEGEIKHDFRIELEAFCNFNNSTKVDSVHSLAAEMSAMNAAREALSEKMSALLLPQADSLLKKGDIKSVQAMISTLPECPTRMKIAAKLAGELQK